MAADKWHFAQEVARQRHRQNPPQAAEYIKREKSRIAHAAHACHERREGADNRHELRVNQRLSAMAPIKCLRLFDVLLFEQTRIGPAEDTRPRAVAQEVAAL